MGEQVLPTMGKLSEAAKRKQKAGVMEANDPQKQGRKGPRT